MATITPKKSNEINLMSNSLGRTFKKVNTNAIVIINEDKTIENIKEYANYLTDFELTNPEAIQDSDEENEDKVRQIQKIQQTLTEKEMIPSLISQIIEQPKGRNSVKDSSNTNIKNRITLIQRNSQFNIYNRNRSLQNFVKKRVEQETAMKFKNTKIQSRENSKEPGNDVYTRTQKHSQNKIYNTLSKSIDLFVKERRSASFKPNLLNPEHTNKITTTVVQRTKNLLKNKNQFIQQQRRSDNQKQLREAPHKPKINEQEKYKIMQPFFTRLEKSNNIKEQNKKKILKTEILKNAYSPVTQYTEYKNSLINNKKKILQKNYNSIDSSTKIQLSDYSLFNTKVQMKSMKQKITVKFPEDVGFLLYED